MLVVDHRGGVPHALHRNVLFAHAEVAATARDGLLLPHSASPQARGGTSWARKPFTDPLSAASASWRVVVLGATGAVAEGEEGGVAAPLSVSGADECSAYDGDALPIGSELEHDLLTLREAERVLLSHDRSAGGRRKHRHGEAVDLLLVVRLLSCRGLTDLDASAERLRVLDVACAPLLSLAVDECGVHVAITASTSIDLPPVRDPSSSVARVGRGTTFWCSSVGSPGEARAETAGGVWRAALRAAKLSDPAASEGEDGDDGARATLHVSDVSEGGVPCVTARVVCTVRGRTYACLRAPALVAVYETSEDPREERNLLSAVPHLREALEEASGVEVRRHPRHRVLFGEGAPPPPPPPRRRVPASATAPTRPALPRPPPLSLPTTPPDGAKEEEGLPHSKADAGIAQPKQGRRGPRPVPRLPPPDAPSPPSSGLAPLKPSAPSRQPSSSLAAATSQAVAIRRRENVFHIRHK